jgi:hypothetical protein
MPLLRFSAGMVYPRCKLRIRRARSAAVAFVVCVRRFVFRARPVEDVALLTLFCKQKLQLMRIYIKFQTVVPDIE